jgi:hypothetical protein
MQEGEPRGDAHHSSSSSSSSSSAQRQQLVCMGGEWYRFPSSFFLPENHGGDDDDNKSGGGGGGSLRLAFVRSHFRAQLPQQFRPVNGTWAPPLQVGGWCGRGWMDG